MQSLTDKEQYLKSIERLDITEKFQAWLLLSDKDPKSLFEEFDFHYENKDYEEELKNYIQETDVKLFDVLVINEIDRVDWDSSVGAELSEYKPNISNELAQEVIQLLEAEYTYTNPKISDYNREIHKEAIKEIFGKGDLFSKIQEHFKTLNYTSKFHEEVDVDALHITNLFAYKKLFENLPYYAPKE